MHSGGIGITGAVVGGLTREWRGFPPSKWGEVEVWVDGLCHWLDDPKTKSSSSASQETEKIYFEISLILYIIHLLLDLDEVPTTDMGISQVKLIPKKIIDDLEIKYLTLTPNILTLTYNSKYLPGGGEDTGVEGFEP